MWTQKLTYISEKKPEELKKQIEMVCFKQKAINLTGKFTSEYEFELTPRWQLINIRNFERELSFIKGKIYKDPLNRCKVEIRVRPNSIFPIFFFLFPIIAVIVFYNFTNTDNLFLILTFGVIVPFGCLIVGQISRNLIRERFIETFKLEKVVRS